jgi:hypothetical protein
VLSLGAEGFAALATLSQRCAEEGYAGGYATIAGPVVAAGADAKAAFAAVEAPEAAEALLGLGRIVALYYSASTLYQIHEHIRCSISEATMRPNPRRCGCPPPRRRQR